MIPQSCAHPAERPLQLALLHTVPVLHSEGSEASISPSSLTQYVLFWKQHTSVGQISFVGPKIPLLSGIGIKQNWKQLVATLVTDKNSLVPQS